jgi:hypothetical protein
VRRPVGSIHHLSSARWETKSLMPGAKRIKSRIAAPKRAAAAMASVAVVAEPPERSPKTGTLDLRIAILPPAAAPSVAHWRSFAASIARVESRGYPAPTVWVDPNLRGATVRIAGWDTVSAIRMVNLHASNSPSPQLWQSQYYEVTVIHSDEPGSDT